MSEFHRLVETEIPRLRRYARALTRSADRADDLVQETLLRAISKSHLWQTGTDIRAWLFTIMHNHYVNMVRRAMRDEAPQSPASDVDSAEFACKLLIQPLFWRDGSFHPRGAGGGREWPRLRTVTTALA